MASNRFITNDKKAYPFIKWAGSKRKLIKLFDELLPERFGTYYEPFFGSGSLFFSIEPKRAIVGDMCSELINTYQAVHDNASAVISYLKQLSPDKDSYYTIRSNRSKGRFKRAAEFIYLNKTCWNGLYRVNLSGDFNVPYGQHKTPIHFDYENIIRAHKAFKQSVKAFHADDFEITCKNAKRGDFVFLDPPYVTTHNNNGFLEWNESIFSWEDQERLAKMALRLSNKGVSVVITNAHHDSVLDLYPNFAIKRIERASTLASSSMHRRKVEEAVIYRVQNG